MTIKVKVIPRARKTRIIQEKDILKVYLNEPAIHGRANQKLIELLAQHYQVKKYQITIIKGQKQREKLVQIGETNQS
ncbi:MAG: DUF167 domain-containing protein [Candidatus Omnitrophica bacterium]|nr:DUF167 domain-containing protein [Candidatus Omnitrophota bacterium]MBU2044697.1 DUF167 domain-containing protein [Candidatus Omnitrophota bacterium]MBU2251581.1 DUF167 domain-containing protein [Candidatus Omnitrophota bacterium]MBU2473466.1 DUF167 domain-containing protein [Candidatus Omnitrophota bacterium]